MPVYTSGANLARITQPNAAGGHNANGSGYWRADAPPRAKTRELEPQAFAPTDVSADADIDTDDSGVFSEASSVNVQDATIDSGSGAEASSIAATLPASDS